MRLRSALLAMSIASSCASPPPRPSDLLHKQDPMWNNGIRQKPLETSEVVAAIKKKLVPIRECYARERLNTTEPASLIMQLEIPTDGSGPVVSVARAEPAGQIVLEACVTDILKALEFPPHVGEPIKLQVPFKPEGP